jgi:hypothetical protein
VTDEQRILLPLEYLQLIDACDSLTDMFRWIPLASARVTQKSPGFMPMQMKRFIRRMITGISLTAAPLATLSQGNPYQGVYTGNKAVEMGDQGYKPSFFPSTLTVLPNGHSIIITSQLPNNVLTSVLRGSFTGNIFEGRTRARLNLAVYNYGTYYKIRFVGNEARIEKDLTINPPEGYVAPAKVQVFCKTHS